MPTTLKRNLQETLWSRRLSLKGVKPTITFTFDDFPRSAYVEAGPILKKYHARGTYYVSMKLLDSESPLGPYCTRNDIRRLVEDGHELGCHTFSHCDAKVTPPPEYQEDIVRNLRSIQTVVPSFKFRSFAYPFGRVTLRLKQRVGRLFDCCRGTYDGINTDQADLNLLRSNGLSNEAMSLHQVKALIEQNRSASGWLIFYTHDVRDHYSSWGCSPEYFETVLRYASESGSRILTVSESLESIRHVAYTQESDQS